MCTKVFIAEIVSSDRFVEDTDLSTMYLGQIDMARDMQVKAEENFPITTWGYMKGKLMDGMECDILVDTGTGKSYMVQVLLHEMQMFYILCQSSPPLPQESK